MKLNAYEKARLASFDGLRACNITGVDAPGMIHLIGQATKVESTVYTAFRQPLVGERLVPFDFTAGEATEKIAYTVVDRVGKGRRSSGKGTHIPTSDAASILKYIPVVSGETGYHYTQEELMKASIPGLAFNLPSERVSSAILAYREHVNEVALFGEMELEGLLNSSVVPQGSPDNGDWANATNDEIIDDFNNAINDVYIQSGNNVWVDTVLVPSELAPVFQRPRASGSDMSLLKWILENNMSKTQGGVDLKIEFVNDMATIGVGSTKRALFYKRAPEFVVMHVPMAVRFLAPQPVGLQVNVPGHYKYSGVHFRYIKAAKYVDGV